MKRVETADDDETISNTNRGMPPASTLALDFKRGFISRNYFRIDNLSELRV